MKMLVLLMSALVSSCATADKAFESVTNETRGLRRTSLKTVNTEKLLRPYTRMALNSTLVGPVIAEEKYFNWCTSPLEVDGKIHLFHCRWPNNSQTWFTKGEIVHYVSDNPEGPFKFVGKVLTNANFEKYGYLSPVNPRLEKVDGKFMLLFTLQTKGTRAEGQKIGMALADDINGPWELVGKDSIVLHATPKTPGAFTYGSLIGVNNPAFLKVGSKYHIYFKYKNKKKTGYAVAVADKLTGPYKVLGAVTENISYIEDAQAFSRNGKHYLLTCDNHGSNTGHYGAIILWESKDGLDFKRADSKIAFGTLFDYWKGNAEDRKKLLASGTFVYNKSAKFERPAILFLKGKPAYFYGISCVNLEGGKRSSVYALKINE